MVSSINSSKANDRISFHGTLDLHVILQAHDPEGGMKDEYPGEFAGYLDATGIHLESASADTSSFYK